MAVTAKVSDFEGEYKAYSVYTRDGAAFKGANYGRAVDIGSPVSYALTTNDAQALYGDTAALQVRNQWNGRPWPADPQLYEAPVKMISLALSFNRLSNLMAEAAETGIDPVLQAFAKAAQKHNVRPLGEFFIIPSQTLPAGTKEDETVSDATMEEAARHIARKPHNIVVKADGADTLLESAHASAMLIEKQQPGFIGGNKFHLVGLYRGNSQPVAALPIPVQDRAPISQVTSEIRRTLG